MCVCDRKCACITEKERILLLKEGSAYRVGVGMGIPRVGVAPEVSVHPSRFESLQTNTQMSPPHLEKEEMGSVPKDRLNPCFRQCLPEEGANGISLKKNKKPQGKSRACNPLSPEISLNPGDTVRPWGGIATHGNC